MKYPVLSNWIRFEKINDEEYLIRDLLIKEEYTLNSYCVHFAQQLDGKTDPYKIDRSLSWKNVSFLLGKLEKANMIRRSRVLFKSFPNIYFTLWMPKVTPLFRRISFLINEAVKFTFLPLFIFSVWFFITECYDLNLDYLLSGSIVGLILGMFLHESGHMFASLGYGGEVFEMGVMIQFLLPGAYVLTNHDSVRRRMRRVQIYAAGIEMNLILASVFMIIATVFPAGSGFFFGGAVQNVFVAFLNLTFVNGFDGMAIISELLGVKDLADSAKKLIKNMTDKKRLSRKGASGKAAIAVCYAVRIVQIALPLVFGVNIAGVIACFL